MEHKVLLCESNRKSWRTWKGNRITPTHLICTYWLQCCSKSYARFNQDDILGSVKCHIRWTYFTARPANVSAAQPLIDYSALTYWQQWRRISSSVKCRHDLQIYLTNALRLILAIWEYCFVYRDLYKFVSSVIWLSLGFRALPIGPNWQ
jgi:hypothetical protein